MADDNVVRPTFGKKPSADPLKNATASSEPRADDVSDDYTRIGPLTGDALVRAQKDLLYMMNNVTYVQITRERLEEAGDVIFGLARFSPHDENIRLRRNGLKELSLENICQQVEHTHELQWRSQPSYLGALTLEYHHRVQAALSLMNEDKSPG